MKLELIGRDYKITDNFRDLIDKKVQKLNKYFGDNAQIKISCRFENNVYKMEVSISSKNMSFRSEASSTENMYETIDMALPKLERQIVKHKNKLVDRLKDNAFEMPDLMYIDNDIEESTNKIVKNKSFELDPLTTDDAILFLEMSDHNFYIYLNAETGNVNVIYKRNDGNYGNIEVR